MKILHILGTSKWTGPASYVVDILDFLNKNNISNFVAIRSKPSGILKNILKERDINFIELNLYKKFNPIYFYQDIKNLNKLIKNFQPDIIHTHYSTENILSFFVKNKTFKLIRSIHNTKSSKKRLFSKFILKRNDFFHTVCSEYKNNLVKFNGISPEKIRVISGWVDIKNFNPHGKKYFKNNSIKIGMVARFQQHRGHEFLVRAYHNLKNKNVKLILTGRGEYKKNIEKLVDSLNLNDNVIFTGYIKDELPSLLRSLDIFVLLEEGSDGTCRAILEAMASGLPVISVKKGAIQETVIDEINGFLIPSKKDINSLTEKLKILVENKNLRKKFGENSRKIAEEKFCKEKKLKQFLDFYLNIT